MKIVALQTSQLVGARESRPRARGSEVIIRAPKKSREKVDFSAGLKARLASPLFAMPLTMSRITYMECGLRAPRTGRCQ